MADVRLERITKRFGDVVALNEIDLQIEDGEFFCVLGPPGAGKTTMLRTIVGLERPSAGSVHVGGTDVTDVPPGARNVSIVFQNLALYPDKSVYDNLAFPLRQQKPRPPKEEIDRRVRDAAKVLRIEQLLARAHVRSSGEGEAFWRSFREVADDALPTGNIVPDAHLAALMLENEVRTILTRDRDFRRFPRLEVRDPFG